MIAISLRFPAGRFHATPWGRHVNEAAPEWPPSPWRVLRTLIATWKRKLNQDFSPVAVRDLLLRLATPPTFFLPPATLGHTRHYMPWLKKGPDDRTLIFDPFVAVHPTAAVVLAWPNVAIGETERQMLEALVRNLGFLGRAESWCEAELLSDDEAVGKSINCFPLERQVDQSECEIIRVLCADPDSAFGDEYVDDRYDPKWNLCMETSQLHAERWSDPPGAAWVRYARPRGCFKIARRRVIPMTSRAAYPQIARFALDSSVLPLVFETLPMAENARRILMGTHGRLTSSAGNVKGKSATFSGKDAEGKVEKEHSHAYYLPTDEDGDGKLDHFTVIASAGFDPAELKALDRFTEFKSRERDAMGHPLRAVLLGLGTLNDYSPLPLRQSADWESATPFVVTRHLKKRGTKRDAVDFWNDQKRFIAEVLREELERWLLRQPTCRDLNVEDIRITPLVDPQDTFRIGKREFRPIQFKRFRQKHGDDGGRRPCGAFRLTFPRPVPGPICLGHSSHFGMGLFLPTESN
jgi:CRISPR-associated protein Csb2